MADPKIKKIQIDTTSYDIEDAAAVKEINGYAKADVEGQTVTFANTPISETEINSALGISSGN
jgi:hypothetical protein